jgi:hypothetical protein
VGDARGDAARAVHERLDWSPWEDGAWWFVAPFLISQLGHGIITTVSVPSRMLREHYAIMLGWIVASSAVADRGGGPRPQRSVAQDARSIFPASRCKLGRLARRVAAAKPVVAVPNGGGDSTSTVRARMGCNRSRALASRLPLTGCFELLITERRSASEDLRGVDVRLDPGSPGLLAQQLVSLRKVVALLDQHPDGAVQHR